MWLKIFASSLTAGLSLMAMGKQSICEDSNAKAYVLSAGGQQATGDKQLREWMNAQPADKNLSLFVLKRAPGLPISRMSCEPDSLLFDGVRSTLNVKRKCRTENGHVITYSFYFVVCEQREVPIAIKPMRRLSSVPSGSVRWDSRRVLYRGRSEGMKADVVVACRTTRSVREGTILNSENLELTPLVERKHAVKIRSESAGLSLELSGVALIDGWAGDMVRVRSSVNGSVLDAKVESAGVVRIDG